MIHYRHPSHFIPGLLLLVCGLAASSYGQLSPDIISSADPTPQRALIDAHVDAQVKKLLNPDPMQWTLGRAQLIDPVTKQGASAGFFDVYADSVNDHLLKQLMSSKDARVRLNAAIVTARIAKLVSNGRLANVTLALLKDPSDGVVLWGLQAAKYVVPPLLATMDKKKADEIGAAAVQAVKDHMTPAVIEEGYRTLLLDPTLPGEEKNFLADINAQMLASFLPYPAALYEYRIKLYDDVDAPKQPMADTWATAFFVNEKVWGAQTAAQQGQTLNLMLGLLRGAAKQNAAAASPEMIDVIKRTGQGFLVAGGRMKPAALADVSRKVAELQPTSAPDEIGTAIDNLEAAVKALGLPAATARNP